MEMGRRSPGRGKRSRVTAWLPDIGLLREHHDYCTWATDAAPIYHVASMLTSMASVCADQAQVIIDDTPYPLHVWTMLVGRSSQDRKTTSAQLAISRIQNAFDGRVLQIYGSPEAIINDLVANPCVTLFVPEGQAFFEQREAGYWRHARGLFMDLYDYKTKFERRLVRETITVHNPRVSILAATARPLLERYTRDTDWLGGFLARFLMISGEAMTFQPKRRSNPVAERRIEQLVHNVFHGDWGTMGCTSGAAKVLDDFAYEIHSELESFPEGLHPSLSRLPDTARRIAGLYEIARQADKPPSGKGRTVLVTSASAECARALCRASRDHALASLAETTISDPWKKTCQRVEGLIRRAGVAGLKRSVLMRKTRMRVRDFDEALRGLFEEHTIRVETRRPSGSGRPSQYYVHKDARADIEKQAASQPVGSAVYICIDDASKTDISGLRQYQGAPLGVGSVYDPDDDDDGGGGSAPGSGGFKN